MVYISQILHAKDDCNGMREISCQCNVRVTLTTFSALWHGYIYHHSSLTESWWVTNFEIEWQITEEITHVAAIKLTLFDGNLLYVEHIYVIYCATTADNRNNVEQLSANDSTCRTHAFTLHVMLSHRFAVKYFHRGVRRQNDGRLQHTLPTGRNLRTMPRAYAFDSVRPQMQCNRHKTRRTNQQLALTRVECANVWESYMLNCLCETRTRVRFMRHNSRTYWIWFNPTGYTHKKNANFSTQIIRNRDSDIWHLATDNSGACDFIAATEHKPVHNSLRCLDIFNHKRTTGKILFSPKKRTANNI